MSFIDITNQKFGEWTVLYKDNNYSVKLKSKCARWMCICSCGKQKSVSSKLLRNGQSKSCGHLKLSYNKNHNMSRSRVYKIWAAMIQRCTNSKNTGYYMYGAKGISVCNEWLKFENFYNDMGDCGDNSLDRIDNTKGYYKDNCRWATKVEQANNRCSTKLVTIDGITKSIAEWARSIGQRKGALYYRISTGMTIEDAITKPFPKRKKYPKKENKLQHTEERLIWQGIKKRCKNGYIYFDNKFSDFDTFFKEVGKRPSKEYSIDRINNKKGYEPGNIRWANKKEQAVNRSTTILLTVGDKTMCKSDWAKLTNTTIGTISKRLNLGWSHKDAIYGRSNL